MMEIPVNVLEDIVRQTVDVGDVFLVELDKSDGITPKEGDETRRKFSWYWALTAKVMLMVVSLSTLVLTS